MTQCDPEANDFERVILAPLGERIGGERMPRSNRVLIVRHHADARVSNQRQPL